MIILRLLLESLANGVAAIPALPLLDDVAAKNWYTENPEECVSLVVDRQEKLASAFREHMTKGQLYHAPNINRRTFYEEVITGAEQVNFLSFPVL